MWEGVVMVKEKSCVEKREVRERERSSWAGKEFVSEEGREDKEKG